MGEFDRAMQLRALRGHDPRRVGPRVGVESFCAEVEGSHMVPSLVIDLSPEGARVERPFQGGRTPDELFLEFEVPDIDEVMWAKGAVCFDHVRPAPAGTPAGPFGLIRTTGIRIISAASRELKILREFVFERRRDEDVARLQQHELLMSSCYLRG